MANKEAIAKWGLIPKDKQELLLNNVWCGNCKNTSIVDYKINNDKYGILLKGKCKKCGKDVARLIED